MAPTSSKVRAKEFYKIFKNAPSIDYKNIDNLRPFTDRFGRIVARYYSGMSLRKQKMLARAIKNARHMALMPFTK